MTQHSSINHLDLFSYYRIERFAAENLRNLLSQLLETYMEQGDCVVLLHLEVDGFKALAQAYRDILLGYRHPRTNSMCWAYRERDVTLRKLASIFPELQAQVTPADLLPKEKCTAIPPREKPKSNPNNKSYGKTK